MNRLVSMLSILLVVMPALDVIKYEGKSGYDKYVLTLPVNRRHIVQSHYLFYFFNCNLRSIIIICHLLYIWPGFKYTS